MSYTQIQKIISSSPGVNNHFGTNVVIDGYYAAVSEPTISTTWLYKRNLDGDWESRVDGGLSVDGDSLAMYGNYLVIGDVSAGTVSIYNKDTTSDTVFGGSIANTVALSPKHAIIPSANVINFFMILLNNYFFYDSLIFLRICSYMSSPTIP